VTWLTTMCDMTHSYVWHDSLICVTWLIHMCDMTHYYVRHDNVFICVIFIRCSEELCLAFICVIWLTTMCDMTHWYVCHESLICVPWLIRMCDMTHSYVIYIQDARRRSVWHSYVWHDSLLCAISWLICRCDIYRVLTADLFRTQHWKK